MVNWPSAGSTPDSSTTYFFIYSFFAIHYIYLGLYAPSVKIAHVSKKSPQRPGGNRATS